MVQRISCSQIRRCIQRELPPQSTSTGTGGGGGTTSSSGGGGGFTTGSDIVVGDISAETGTIDDLSISSLTVDELSTFLLTGPIRFNNKANEGVFRIDNLRVSGNTIDSTLGPINIKTFTGGPLLLESDGMTLQTRSGSTNIRSNVGSINLHSGVDYIATISNDYSLSVADDITISTNSGQLTINGNLNLNNKFDNSTYTGSLILPKGTTAQQEPIVAGIRYNTDLNIFEGYYENGDNDYWASLGGVRSIDGGTKINISEGTNDTLRFYVDASDESSPVGDPIMTLTSSLLSISANTDFAQNVDIANNLSVYNDTYLRGNLTVIGTTTTVTTASLDVSAPLMTLGNVISPTNNYDIGFLGIRDNKSKIGHIWDNNNAEFALIFTDDDGETVGNVSLKTSDGINGYADLHSGNLTLEGHLSIANNLDINNGYQKIINNNSVNQIITNRKSLGTATGSGNTILLSSLFSLNINNSTYNSVIGNSGGLKLQLNISDSVNKTSKFEEYYIQFRYTYDSSDLEDVFPLRLLGFQSSSSNNITISDTTITVGTKTGGNGSNRVIPINIAITPTYSGSNPTFYIYYTIIFTGSEGISIQL